MKLQAMPVNSQRYGKSTRPPPPLPLPTVQCCGGQSAQQKVQAEIVHRVHISDAYTPKTGQRVGVRRGNGIRNSLPSLERPKILVSLSLHLPLSIYLSFYNHIKYGASICGICGLQYPHETGVTICPFSHFKRVFPMTVHQAYLSP